MHELLEGNLNRFEYTVVESYSKYWAKEALGQRLKVNRRSTTPEGADSEEKAADGEAESEAAATGESDAEPESEKPQIYEECAKTKGNARQDDPLKSSRMLNI